MNMPLARIGKPANGRLEQRLHLLRQPRDGGQLAFDLGLVEGLLGRLNIRNVCMRRKRTQQKCKSRVIALVR